MKETEDTSKAIDTFIKDETCAVILWNLLDERAHTAVELTKNTNTDISLVKKYLSQMVQAGIVIIKNRRRPYFKYIDSTMAQLVNTKIDSKALNKKFKKLKRPPVNDFTYARTCYQHLAGVVGVKVTAALLSNRLIEPTGEEYRVTKKGEEWFKQLGLTIDEIKHPKKVFAFQCLDWSERKPHLSGSLGVAFLNIMIQKKWIEKKKESRELIITSVGKTELNRQLNVKL